MGESSISKDLLDGTIKAPASGKRSLFERQKAEAEAKRRREEVENAAALDDFVKSFEGDEAGRRKTSDDARQTPGGGHGALKKGTASFTAVPKRHFAPGGPRGNSGPGSLGLPPSSIRKRQLDGAIIGRRDKEVGLLAFENAIPGHGDSAHSFQNSDDEDDRKDHDKAAEKAAPKPTLHLSSLPPGTSPAVIKSIIPPSLTVDGVRVMPQPSSGPTERRSISAIVTLAKDTPASEIDSVVGLLQDRYLGWGYNLSLCRHLSSAALGVMGAAVTASTSTSSSQPFGAKAVSIGLDSSLSRAPPPEASRRGIPPLDFAGSGSYARPGWGRPSLRVRVEPPSDIRQLKLIHKTVESLLKYGPEFEALLMSRPEVQRSPEWAWLWDARTQGGVWYRWKLWETISGESKTATDRTRRNELTRLLFDGGAPWQPPTSSLQFEFVTDFDNIISDPEYDSSAEEESADEGFNPSNLGRGETVARDVLSPEKSYLNPLKRAKLVHLLARLPKSTGWLRKGDVARVTAFAISQAGEGAQEVVVMIILNVEKPLAWSMQKSRNTTMNGHKDTEADEENAEKQSEKDDPSSSKLIALYIISDILSSSSTSGVRQAWKYRQLFEAVLKQRKVFESLGRLEKHYQWGRLRAEKWKRSVQGVLSLWDSWCVFPQAAQEEFVSSFLNPPLTIAEQEEAELQKTKEKEQQTIAGAKSKWKTLDPNNQASAEEADTAMDDVDGEPLLEDDLDGEPMQDDDSDGMSIDSSRELVAEHHGEVEQSAIQGNTGAETEDNRSEEKDTNEHSSDGAMKRRRPKAEDMFADSEED